MHPHKVEQIIASVKTERFALKHGFDDAPYEMDDGEEIRVAEKLEWINNDTNFRLPGHGEQKDECGNIRHWARCPNHGQPTIDGKKHSSYPLKDHCDSPDCPVCFPIWAHKRGKKATEKIEGSFNAYKKLGVRLGWACHMILSPPRDYVIENTKEGYKKYKADVYEHYKTIGLVGGICVYHPARKNAVDKPNFNPLVMPNAWYTSPHNHAVGFMPKILMKSDEFEKLTRWTYKTKWLLTYDDVLRVIRYQLSHCGISDGLQVGNWFGLLGNSKVSVVDEIIKEEIVTCASCGEQLHSHPNSVKASNDGGYVDEPDLIRDDGEFSHFVKIRVYEVKLKVEKPVYNPLTCGFDMVMSKHGVTI